VRRLAPLVVAVLVVALASGCRSVGRLDEPPSDLPGIREQADGSVVAVGTLEWVDLEGGFWAVTADPVGDAASTATIAVIANGADFEPVLRPLAGRTVSVSGRRFGGVSIRMAGPEIEMVSVEPLETGRSDR